MTPVLKNAGQLAIQDSFSIFDCHHQDCRGKKCKQLIGRLEELEPEKKREIKQKLEKMNSVLVLFFHASAKNYQVEFVMPELQACIEPASAGLPNFRSICCLNSTLQVLNCLCLRLEYQLKNQTYIPLERAQKMLALTLKFNNDTLSDDEKAQNKTALAQLLAKTKFSGIDFTKDSCRPAVLAIIPRILEQDTDQTTAINELNLDVQMLTSLVINHFHFLYKIERLIDALNTPSRARYLTSWPIQQDLIQAFSNYLRGMAPTAFRKISSWKSQATFSLSNTDAQEILKYLIQAIGLSESPMLTITENHYKQLQVYKRGECPAKFTESRLEDFAKLSPSYKGQALISEIVLDVNIDCVKPVIDASELTLDACFQSLVAVDITDEENSAYCFYTEDSQADNSGICKIEPNETGRVLTTTKFVPHSDTPPDALLIQLQIWGLDYKTIATLPIKMKKKTLTITRAAVILINAIRDDLVVKVPICRTKESEPELIDYKIKAANCRVGTSTKSGHYTYLEFRENGDVVHIDDSFVVRIDNMSNKEKVSNWVFVNNITPSSFLLERVGSWQAKAATAATPIPTTTPTQISKTNPLQML